jgi:cyanate permease
MMGFVKDQTGSYTVALLTLAAWVLISAAVALGFSYSTALEHRPEDEALSPV